MICPKCDEGTIVKIRFKKNGRPAYLCDVCGTLWFEGENIKFNTGHTLDSYSQTQDIEYEIEELQEKDQDHQPARNKNYK